MGKIIYNKGFKDAIIKQTNAPTITFVEKDDTSITVAFTNNSGSEATISYGISSPPNNGTILLESGVTSDNVVISGLDFETTYTIFASANGTPENLIESSISSTSPITTDSNPFVIFTDTSGSPGPSFPINDLDGNIMADLNKGIAYYGLVSTLDLYTGDELASEIGLTAGLTINNEDMWHKYYWNGGIHFWKKPTRYDVSWNEIAATGSVYGTGTTTSRKGYSNTSVNQNTEVTKNNLTYIVRLIERSSFEPSNTTDNTYGSEFNLILMNLHAATNSGSYSDSPTDGVTYANWSNYSNNDFVGWKTNINDQDIIVGNEEGRATWAQETHSTTSSRLTYAIFNAALVDYTNVSTDGFHSGWSPVLTVKHPSFVTYGKSGGFNQSEPDW